jgi:membrane-associated phospholipid phosphatase
MELIGRPVLKYGPKIDEPIEQWTHDHQVRAWAEVAERLNKVGSSWTTWAAAGTAGACLSASWRQQKWLPPAVLATAIAVDKTTTLALRHRFRRLGPPSSPAGTYPAGGPDRVVLFTGLIANMLWREFSGSERGKVLAVGAVAGLTFNMTYCREYLSKHWFTDIMSGVFYGAVLYTPFAVAIRAIAGPPVRRAVERRSQYPSLLVDHRQGVTAGMAPVPSARP